MPYQYKFTMFFEGGGQGWTESWVLYNQSQIGLGILNTAYGNQLVNLRSQLLSNSNYLTYLRINQIGTPFASQLFEYNQIGQYQAITAPINVALLLNAYGTAPGPAKHVFLRGIPESVVSGSSFTLSYAFQASFNAYVKFLQVGSAQVNWGWIAVISKTFSPTKNSYTQNVDETVTVTSNIALWTGVPVGTKILVRFSGFNGKSQLNGTQVCYVESATTVQTKDQIALAPYVYGGRIEYPIFGQNGLSSMNVERIMTRKAGRPFFVERGRAPRRART